jgi:hypothetical protein
MGAGAVFVGLLSSLALLALLALLSLYAWYFAAHAWEMLRFPYPLDYGEGPLLLQARLLLNGTSLAGLYADPALPPYAVVNYPPLYLLLTVALARPLGDDALLAGRLLSLIAALGSALMLALLVRTAPPRSRSSVAPWLLVIGLSWLALPVVRQWALLLRVDMLGVFLGLCALLVLRIAVSDRAAGTRPPLGRRFWLLALAAALLVASLYIKPSLLAAPLAACAWAWLRRPRQGLLLAALLAALGGGLFVLLNVASRGWFFFHVVAANANRWDATLARQFWAEQLAQLWPLLLVGLLGAPLLPRARALGLPLLYALGGALTAVGVGKVGAYANYFLELHAGLLWLAGSLLVLAAPAVGPAAAEDGGARKVPRLLRPLVLVALLICFARYYPLWDALAPRQAGILNPNPPRLAVGAYGLWDDQRRERQLLAVFAATQDALNQELRAAPGALLSDTPGLLVAAGAPPRVQIFEHRQLLDQGLWDQGPLLRELANGEIPLAVVDYLGNWLSPEMVALLRHRYAMDGSLGLYSLYRPLALGPRMALEEELGGGGLRVTAYHLAAPPGQNAFGPGQTLALGLELRRMGPLDSGLELVARIAGGEVVAERALPPLYGALGDAAWPFDEALQHSQPLRLPPDLAPGRYRLELGLRLPDGGFVAPMRPIADVDVAPVGQVVGEQYLPTALLAEWRRLGGEGAYGPGLPMMPATPFARGLLQCFERACLDLHGDGTVARRPLGAILSLDQAMWPTIARPPREDARWFPETEQALDAGFAPLWHELGGAQGPGPPVSAPLDRLGFQVQYTSYARLERARDGSLALGRVGDDYLRRPPGVPYGWPPLE